MQRQKLGVTIAQDLKQRIIDGEFSLDEKIPAERVLAEGYNVSRIPVREAIQILTEEGILEKKASSGSVVKKIPEYVHNPSAFSQEKLAIHNKDFLIEALRLRRRIESECAREAAIHADAAGIERIQQALFSSISEARKLRLGEENTFLEADWEYHLTIARETGSPFYLECLSTIPTIVRAHQKASLSFIDQKDYVIPYHTMIFERILERDPDGAYDAMYRHISRVEELLSQS